MATRLFVGIWSINTLGHSWFNLDNGTKLTLLEKAVRKTYQHGTHQQIQGALGAGNMTGVFLAPEYLFANISGTAEKPIDPNEHAFVMQRFQRMSLSYPELLIFPGTVAFKNKIQTQGERKQILDQLRNHMNALRDPTMDWGTARLLWGNKITNYAQQHKADIDDHGDKMKRLAGIKKKDIKAGNYYMSRNTAYGLHQGQHVLTYHKRGEVGEIVNSSSPIFFVNGTLPGTTTVGGVKFGLEVCKDSTEGYLKGTGLNDVEVQVVLSASVDTRDIRKLANCHLLHCCQVSGNTSVHDENGNTVNALGSTKICGGPLTYYDITIP